jgi:hypothetical protein
LGRLAALNRGRTSLIDPIGAYTRVAGSVVSYIKTAFGTRFPSLEEERERLLRRPGAISQEPWIEPLPRYESSGKTVADLTPTDVPGLSSQAVADFMGLAACGLVGEFPLHRHQVEMLTKALQGQSCVITAGTGSGKTEAFLLPLFASQRLVVERRVAGSLQPARQHEAQVEPLAPRPPARARTPAGSRPGARGVPDERTRRGSAQQDEASTRL